MKKIKDMQPCDMESTYADVEDLFRHINYKPATPPLTEGIDKFVKNI